MSLHGLRFFIFFIWVNWSLKSSSNSQKQVTHDQACVHFLLNENPYARKLLIAHNFVHQSAFYSILKGDPVSVKCFSLIKCH